MVQFCKESDCWYTERKATEKTVACLTRNIPYMFPLQSFSSKIVLNCIFNGQNQDPRISISQGKKGRFLRAAVSKFGILKVWKTLPDVLQV